MAVALMYNFRTKYHLKPKTSPMKAVILNEYGSADVLKNTEVEKPTYGASQILMRVKASGINLIDAKMRAGDVADMMPKSFPLILGWEASGIVDAIGSNVKNFKAGDEVYSHINMMAGGSYAEYVAVHENEAALKPKILSHVQAATVPMNASTAYTSLIKIANIQKGQKVLIHGAAGSVGSFAVQIARMKGAYVIATTSGKGLTLVKELGADEVIDYKTTDFTAVVKDADMVLDVLGGETQIKSLSVLKQGGLLLTTVPLALAPEKLAEYDVTAEFFFTSPDASILAQLAQWIDEGKLKTPEPIILNLSKASKAHRMMEERTAHGKLVFEIS